MEENIDLFFDEMEDNYFIFEEAIDNSPDDFFIFGDNIVKECELPELNMPISLLDMLKD